MTGPAEERLSAEYPAVVADLQEIVGTQRARYETASGFRYVFDAVAGGETADVSALAQELSVLVAAVVARPLQPPGGPEPGIVQRSEEPESTRAAETTSGADPGSETSVSKSSPSEAVAASVAVATAAPATTTASAGTAATVPEVAPQTAADALLPSIEALLSVPTSVAARERAEQACRAMAKGWYQEAERLFLDGAEVNPIDPFSWFGAGLSASHLDINRAATHLEKASRYLMTDDPAGAAYATIVAAALFELDHRQASAERLLEQRLRELDRSCPAISLHLGRLGGARRARLSEAISVDPMLQVDVNALDLCPTGSLVADRRRRTKSEIDRVNDLVKALRHDPSQEAENSDAGSQPDALSEDEHLSLVEAEVELWRQIDKCEEQVDKALQTMKDKERRRREMEDQLEKVAEEADDDLDPQATSQFFAVSVLIALAIIFVFIIGNSLARSYPLFGGVFGVLTWLGVAGLLALEIRAFVLAWWPSRLYPTARIAKGELPHLDAELSENRSAEFRFRRHYFDESEKAEQVIDEILGTRDGLVPRRPVFLAPDLPLVPARNQASSQRPETDVVAARQPG